MASGMARTDVLERITDERVTQTVVGSVSTAVDRLADEIAQEALRDESFRRGIRELVHRRSEELLDRLFRESKRKKRKR